MNVYQVKLNTDDFQSMITVDPEIISKRVFALDGTSKKSSWPDDLKLQIDNADKPAPDVFSCGVGNIFLYRQSLECLAKIVSRNCELLSATCGGLTGFVVNVVGFTDCLDAEMSTFATVPETGKRLFLKKFVFSNSRVPCDRFFKIKESPFKVFVAELGGTECILSQIVDAGLTGFALDRVWSNQP